MSRVSSRVLTHAESASFAGLLASGVDLIPLTFKRYVAVLTAPSPASALGVPSALGAASEITHAVLEGQQLRLKMPWNEVHSRLLAVLEAQGLREVVSQRAVEAAHARRREMPSTTAVYVRGASTSAAGTSAAGTGAGDDLVAAITMGPGPRGAAVVALEAVGHGTQPVELLEAFRGELEATTRRRRLVHRRNPQRARLHMLQMGPAGPEFYEVGAAGERLVRDNYPAASLYAYDRALAMLIEQRPQDGRIALFSGPPGTGKTYMIRGLLAALATSYPVRRAATGILLADAETVGQLATPLLTTALRRWLLDNDYKTAVVLAEDCDVLLAARDVFNVAKLSTALNFGDGILADVLDVRLVLSANTPVEQLDPAATRNGRLAAHVSLEALPRAQAARVLARVTGREIPPPTQWGDSVSLADVYAAARSAGESAGPGSGCGLRVAR